LKVVIAVFVGGGLGSLVRFGMARWRNAYSPYSFPLGTFAVNIVACFVLGLVVGLAEQKLVLSPLTRIFWAIGFCGGFSTFSTFSYENLLLIQTGQNLIMLFYTLLSVVICLAAVFRGQFLVARI
jgi:CrcB protein